MFLLLSVSPSLSLIEEKDLERYDLLESQLLVDDGIMIDCSISPFMAVCHQQKYAWKTSPSTILYEKLCTKNYFHSEVIQIHSTINYVVEVNF